MADEKKFRTLDDPGPSKPIDSTGVSWKDAGIIDPGQVTKEQIAAGSISIGPTTVPGELLGIHSPRYKTRLIINCGYQILYEEPMPNRFWRFWQWFLLGWKWENI